MADKDEKFPSEVHKKKRAVNLAVAWTLGGLVLLFFAVTLVRVGGNVADRAF